MSKSAVLRVYGLPTSYDGITYSDTMLGIAKQKDIPAKISTAPNRGTLVIQGTAAPIINQFIEEGRKVRGINFIERSGAAFDVFPNPAANVVLLYGLGSEVSLNSKVSGMVFRNIVEHYAEKQTLLVIETYLPKTELLSRYDFRVSNFIKVEKKQEESWI